MTEQGEANDFDRLVAALLEVILEREQALFSSRVLEEARQPKNVGVMDAPDGYGLAFGSCSDTMEVFLRSNGDRIEEATFVTDGCGPTMACGSMLTQLAQGKSLEEAATMEGADVIIALDGLPPEHVHCATLAVNALHQAVAACRSEGEGESA